LLFFSVKALTAFGQKRTADHSKYIDINIGSFLTQPYVVTARKLKKNLPRIFSGLY